MTPVSVPIWVTYFFHGETNLLFCVAIFTLLFLKVTLGGDEIPAGDTLFRLLITAYKLPVTFEDLVAFGEADRERLY